MAHGTCGCAINFHLRLPAKGTSTYHFGINHTVHCRLHGTFNRVCGARRPEHYVPAVRPNHSWTNGPSTSAVYDEDDKVDTFIKQTACEAGSGRKDFEHTKVAGNCKIVFSFCPGCKRFRIQERRRTRVSEETSPYRRQPLPPLLRVAHSRDPRASCFHEATRILSLSRPPTHTPIRERPTLATVPRVGSTSPGACRLRVPGLRRPGILQQGALDGRL